jgi:proteasome beta subunit
MEEDLKKNILSTGTSLVGIVCSDGVVMAGDRKMTLGGQIVANKNFPKVLRVNDYLLMSVTGQVSSAQVAMKVIAAQLKIKELKDRRRPTVKESASFIATYYFQTIRQASMVPDIVGSLVGGINEDGTAELYTIAPDGAINKVDDYDANLSSGMPYILGFLERQYKKGLSVKEGVQLAMEAIKSSSERDTASGYGVDVFTITKEGIKHVTKQKSESIYSDG